MRVRVIKPKTKEGLLSLISDLLPRTWELPKFLLHKPRYTRNDFQTPNSESKFQNKINPKRLKNLSVLLWELTFLSFFIWIRKRYKMTDTSSFFFSIVVKSIVYNFGGIFKNLLNCRGPQTAFPYTTVTAAANGRTEIYLWLWPTHKLLFFVSTLDFYFHFNSLLSDSTTALSLLEKSADSEASWKVKVGSSRLTLNRI